MFTPNNAAGDVAKFFVAGFDAGFWGGTGRSVNPKDASTLNLSETWNWNANYAYNAILNTAVGYSNALGTGAGTPTGQNRFYDPYAAEFFKNSNAYGYSYTDLISGGGGINPAISLWDKATNANVQTVNIALYDLGETPASGFKTGNTGYVAPTGADYLPATTTSTNQLQFTFGFNVGASFPGAVEGHADLLPLLRARRCAGGRGRVRVLGAGEGRLVLLPAQQERRAMAARAGQSRWTGWLLRHPERAVDGRWQPGLVPASRSATCMRCRPTTSTPRRPATCSPAWSPTMACRSRPSGPAMSA